MEHPQDTLAISMSFMIKGWKKHINFFNINFLDPTQTPILGLRKKVYVSHFLGKNAKRDPHKLFRVDFWGQKRGPKRAIFGHKKFSLLFSCP